MVYTSSNFRQISKDMSNIIKNIKNGSKEMFSKMKLPVMQKKKPIPSEQLTEAEKKKKEIDDAQRVLNEALQRKKKEQQSSTIPSTNLSTSANEESTEMTDSERIKKNLKEFTKRRIANKEKKKKQSNFLYRKKKGSTNDEKPKRDDLFGDYKKRKEMSEAEMLREFVKRNKIAQVPEQKQSGQVTKLETAAILPKQGEAQPYRTLAQRRKAYKNKHYPGMKQKEKVASHQYPNTQPVKQLLKKSFSNSTNDQKSKSNDLFGDYKKRKEMSEDEMLTQFKQRNKRLSGQKQ